MKKMAMAFAIWLALSGAALAVVNINTATKEELTSIKGVGEKRAQDIIDYRKKHGNFKSVDELEKVPGIGPGLMKQIRSEVSVTGKTMIDKPAKAADAPAKAKGSTAKSSDAPKSSATKSDTAKSKTAEKSKADAKPSEKK
jgi:competence protein ComEA